MILARSLFHQSQLLMALMTSAKSRPRQDNQTAVRSDNQPLLARSSNAGLGFFFASTRLPCRSHPRGRRPRLRGPPDSPCRTALPGTPRPRATRATAATARARWRCGAGRRRRRSCRPTGGARTWSTRKGPRRLAVGLGTGSPRLAGAGGCAGRPGCPRVPSCTTRKDGLNFTMISALRHKGSD